MSRKPSFSDDQLRAIHHTLHGLPWQVEEYYEERRAVERLLDKYFRTLDGSNQAVPSSEPKKE